MPIVKSQFKPPWQWRNAQLQTIWPFRFRNPVIPQRTSLLIPTDDGDEILLEYCDGARASTSSLGILLLHGLAGSANSQYIVGLQNIFNDANIFSVAMNFRGAKAPNKMARGYHSGASGDLKQVIEFLTQQYPHIRWITIGFSLGGNVVLKYLGENQGNPLEGAFAVSVPLRLDICADRLDKGFSKIYRRHFLGQLRDEQLRKHQFLLKYDPEEATILQTTGFDKRYRSFRDYDEAIIAPLNGFASAEDYYQKCSSRYFLRNIDTPTYILQSLDDPFTSEAVIPDASELAPSVTMELTNFGGHVGFYEGNGQYYSEKRIIDWINSAADTRIFGEKDSLL